MIDNIDQIINDLLQFLQYIKKEQVKILNKLSEVLFLSQRG